MASLFRTGVLCVLAVLSAMVFASTARPDVIEGGGGCFVCGRLSSSGPYQCFGGYMNGMSQCSNPCSGNVNDCAIT